MLVQEELFLQIDAVNSGEGRDQSEDCAALRNEECYTYLMYEISSHWIRLKKRHVRWMIGVVKNVYFFFDRTV
jgi:hypothetical protein